MRKWLIASLVLNVALVGVMLWALVSFPDWLDRFTARGRERWVTQFEVIGGATGGTVFVGDSITAGARWHELFDAPLVRNRGIGGDTTRDVLERFDQVVALAPEQLFLMIGINDLNGGVPVDETLANYVTLFDRVDAELPRTRVHVQSVLPVNDEWVIDIDPNDVDALNEKLQSESSARGYTFVDLRPVMSDASGQLRKDYSNDGIHLLGPAYAAWRDRLEPLVGK